MLATISMGNPDLGATGTNFMAILQAIDYNNFERFSNVADETAAKLLASFLEYEVLVVVTDRCDFEFSKELLKENAGLKTQLIYRKFK